MIERAAELRRWWGAGAAAVALGLVALAFTGLLGAWFNPIDDATHLVAVERGIEHLSHRRPLPYAWNTALLALAGLRAWVWYLAGIGLHLASGLVLWRLLVALGLGRASAWAGAIVFLTLYAAHEAVAWIAAASGLLSVFFVLLSALAWALHFQARGADRSARASTLQVVAVLALAAAAASKEDAVVAAPLLIGVDLVLGGSRGASRRAVLLRYLPFAAVGALLVALTFDPAVWTERSDVGTYRLSLASVPKLLSNTGLLPWPRRLPDDVAPGWALPLGGLLVILAGLVALRERRTLGGRTVALGLALVLAGQLPFLPGPWAVYVDSRFAYPCAIGLGFAVAAVVERGVPALRLRPRSPVLLGGALLWASVHALAIRSTIEWRCVDPSWEYREQLVGALELVDAAPDAPTLLVAPPGWNPLDVESGVQVLAGPGVLDVQALYLDPSSIEAMLGAHGGRARAFTWLDGTWVSADPRVVPRTHWQRAADAYAALGRGRSVPAILIRPQGDR